MVQVYREKESKRVKAYNARQNSAIFKEKHREATRRWRMNKKNTEQSSNIESK